MKKIFIAILMAVAACGMVACGDENNNPNNSQTEEVTLDIVGTSWRGQYNDQVVHPQAGVLSCEMNWYIDFNPDGTADLLLQLVIGGQAQNDQEMHCTYRYEGLEGALVSVEDGQEEVSPFTVDPYNRQFTIDLRIYTGFSQENPQLVGGPTVFHQVR